jgi:hypothetical protein
LYLLPAFVFTAYGAARTAVFAVFDASIFSGTEIRYLLPATVSFTVAGAWLLADGVRRIGIAVLPGPRTSETGVKPA